MRDLFRELLKNLGHCEARSAVAIHGRRLDFCGANAPRNDEISVEH